ncbi:erythromycin esterase family protein [Clostridium felsineum]|uniref:erythromycin esterase family protein n=1 Tax=Clostridium felsineum TaxID=36839 RepID=UPI00214D3385|nr:erythromycin esterase family protein [Clostridium felsineum]MCR3759669.1 erythromycin esterase family protein [Clostridium felsineum]
MIVVLIASILGYSRYASSREMDTYLDKNHESIDSNSKDFKILDSDVKNNDVILCGEGHAIKYNYKLENNLIEYLNKNYNVNYVLMEYSYSETCYINAYLESGNKEDLSNIFKDFKETASYSDDFYDFLVKLRNYNLTREKDKRIKVVGIDIEHQIPTSIRYLDSIIEVKGKAPDEIAADIDEIKKRAANNDLTNYIALYDNDLKNNILKLQKDMKKSEKCYEEYLGNNYFDFNFIVNNMVNAYDAYLSFSNSANSTQFKKFEKKRELSIYNNFKILHAQLPKGKYFGQFGGEHVYQSSFSDGVYKKEDPRLAMYLNGNGSPVKGKVLSIEYYYKNSQDMASKPPYFSEKVNYLINDKVVNNYLKSDINIFKLDGDKSPFNKSMYFMKYKGLKGSTTDYFKYIVIIKNSPAASVYSISGD